MTRAAGIRERNRVELTAAILTEARAQLAASGAAALSLRAIARELGMASSAIYRYFPSRDALLTQLIVDAYTSLADHVDRAESRVARADLRGRFRAVGRAVRGWALAHEHEYALIYGTPVPGYRAPDATIGPATRVSAALMAVVADAVTAGLAPTREVTPAERRSLAPVLGHAEALGFAIPADLMMRGLMAWTLVVGAVSFELFGHVHNVVADERTPRSAFFDGELDRMSDFLGLPHQR
ncbi:MAG: WHG domain-containing protein [Candidatus Nanopelagicales bacterium]